jgi:hypothetical protein
MVDTRSPRSISARSHHPVEAIERSLFVRGERIAVHRLGDDLPAAPLLRASQALADEAV